jgi:endoglucanase
MATTGVSGPTKILGVMGTVVVDPESEWMRRTRPVRAVKTQLRCDPWAERSPVPLDALLGQAAESAAGVMPGVAASDVLSRLQRGVQAGVLAQMLLPAFAKQFRGMTEVDLDRLMQGFAFEQCQPRGALVELLRRKLHG